VQEQARSGFSGLAFLYGSLFYGPLQTCDALLQSCEVLFYGEKTGFLAKCTSQPPVLKQKSTSQVVGSTSQVDKSTSQVDESTSQVARMAERKA